MVVERAYRRRSRGFALTPERREPLGEVLLPNGQRGVCSAVLGLVAHVADRTPPAASGETWALTLRWHDPATATDIPDYDQSRAEAQAERAKVRAERTRADMAQAEAQAERARVRAERTRADMAQAEAHANAQAARRRIMELEEQLRRLRDGP